MRKSIFEKKIFVCIFALITIITACVKNKTTPVLVTTGSSIADVIKLGTNLTIFDSGMSSSHYILTLDSLNPISVAGPFTVFAPVDIAFMNAGIYDSTIAKYHKYDTAYLLRLMKYHIYAGLAQKVSDWANTIGSQRNSPVMSASGDYFFLTIDSSGFYVNGYLVTQPDVVAKNGIMHALSGVLIPPAGNIYQILDSSYITDTSLTFVVAALDRATQGSSIKLDSLLSSSLQYTDSIYTFFAPTNNAFRATKDSTVAIIQAENADSLRILLQTHIIPGRVFSSDFGLDSVRIAYAGDSLFFASTIGNTIQSKGDSTVANFVRTNILATNGIIHKIDQVLFPYNPF